MQIQFKKALIRLRKCGIEKNLHKGFIILMCKKKYRRKNAV
jgi:hypothetical protein